MRPSRLTRGNPTCRAVAAMMRSGMSGTDRQGTRARSSAMPSVSGTTRTPESSAAKPSLSFLQSSAGIFPSCAAAPAGTVSASRAGTRPPRGYRRPTASKVRARERAPHLTAGLVDVFRRDVEALPDATKALQRPLRSGLQSERLHEFQDLLLLLLREVQRLLG